MWFGFYNVSKSHCYERQHVYQILHCQLGVIWNNPFISYPWVVHSTLPQRNFNINYFFKSRWVALFFYFYLPLIVLFDSGGWPYFFLLPLLDYSFLKNGSHTFLFIRVGGPLFFHYLFLTIFFAGNLWDHLGGQVLRPVLMSPKTKFFGDIRLGRLIRFCRLSWLLRPNKLRKPRID